jgi:FlaA1/EpsC-like NDP-sugar epimerase
MNPILIRLRGLFIALFHLSVIALSLSMAFLLRFDFLPSSLESPLLLVGLASAIPVKMLVFYLGGLQRGWWRFAGLTDLTRILVVNAIASAVWIGIVISQVGPEFPRSVYGIDFLVCFLWTAGGRFSVRLYTEMLRAELSPKKAGTTRVLIYGAGAAGRALLRELRINPSLGLQVAGFIDDDPQLRSASIMGVRVLGTGRRLAYLVDRWKRRRAAVDEIIIAIPSATGLQMRQVHANCRAAGIPCRTMPGIRDLLNGKYLSSQIRNISLDDLLGREQTRLEEDRIQQSIVDKVVMITGAAGSIGAELSRQTLSFQPRKLILFDQAESELFKIEQELRQKDSRTQVIPVVGDIRDLRTLDEAVRTHCVDSIYHAAAYKHVPMMEAHIIEAARNNILGTTNVVRIAQKYDVAKFLMISSDKAVNPTSVMGATKRVAELIVSAASMVPGNRTNFVSVRFGNVLGSNGSVVATFQAQIAAGGPVTVTHPEMKRYFMSIREAVQLVLQASTMGKGSEIFVLDMGEPVRVVDLAYNMIHLAGLIPEEDIEIRYVGLRPGEKLFEEIAFDGENMLPTYHEKIRIFKGGVTSQEALTSWLEQLQVFVTHRDTARVLTHIAALVPEYTPQAVRQSVLDGQTSIVAMAG